MITGDDHSLIKPYILIPLVMSAFDRDKEQIRLFADLKTPGPYLDVIEAALDRATREFTELKREFRKRGIKVYELKRSPVGYDAKYVCRGYHRTFSLLYTYANAEGEILMRKYLGLAEETKRPPE